jgi:radical SAM-linked protein
VSRPPEPEHGDASAAAPALTPALPEPVAEPRQRWRLVVARSDDAPALAQREVGEAWTTALEGAGLPLVRADRSTRTRPRISFGAPLPVGMAAEAELIDVVLVDRWPVWRVREALASRLPDGWRLVDLFDVWLAGPPLAGRVAAADYRITLASAPDGVGLERATAEVLAAERLPRERAKGAGTVAYDLRPLLIDLAIEPGPQPIVRTRTRFHPELGTGRPEEVVAALADACGAPLEVASIVRERLVLADDL